MFRGRAVRLAERFSRCPAGLVSHPGWSHKCACNGRATAVTPGGRAMFSDILQELSGRGVSVLLGLVIGGRGVSVLRGLVIGGSVTWLFAGWRRFRQRQSVLCGDARDTVVLNLSLVE